MKLDWGHFKNNNEFRTILYKEIFYDNCYQLFFDVEPGDVVVDIGASIGPFSAKILQNKPSKLFCFEPHPDIFMTLRSNLEPAVVKYDTELICINAGISSRDGTDTFDGVYDHTNKTMNWTKNITTNNSITLKTFVQQYKLDRIDFLKIDCEGGEYDVFTEENLPWIKQNVRKISGEIHFHYPHYKEKFKHFRDTFLPHFNYRILAMNYVDITELCNDNSWIDKARSANLYIDNTQ